MIRLMDVLSWSYRIPRACCTFPVCSTMDCASSFFLVFLHYLTVFPDISHPSACIPDLTHLPFPLFLPSSVSQRNTTHTILVIQFALEMNLPEILSRYGPSKITNGTSILSTTFSSRSSRFPQMERCSTLWGQEEMQRFLASFIEKELSLSVLP